MQFVLKLTLVMGATLAGNADSDRPPKNLAKRQAGVDWPVFLGPSGNSKSPEQGIVTAWSAAGPRKVWELPLAEGYAMPVVAGGFPGRRQHVC